MMLPVIRGGGFMLDESRHFFGKEKVKQLLDIMASLRLNVFHWHLTDEPGWRIEIKKYPLLTRLDPKGIIMIRRHLLLSIRRRILKILLLMQLHDI